MSFLDQLRERERGSPAKLPPDTRRTDKTHTLKNDDLTKLTEPGCVSYASADPPPCGTIPPAIPMTRARREAISKSWDAEAPREYFAALLLGRLSLCGNCAQFQFGEDPAALGQCTHFHCEAWPFVPFSCSEFKASPTPAAPEYLPSCA